MDSLYLLTQRRSIPRLSEPAPEGEVLENMIAAGLRAPDHGALTPWEFVIATGNGLDKLSAILKRAAEADNEELVVVDKAIQAPYRAPMVITIIARIKQHDKVPAIEQHLSAGCAAQAIQMAAVAQGYQGFWRTGKWAYHPVVREAFDVFGDDEIVGFLYVGTPSCTPANPPKRDIDKFVSYL